MYKTYLVAMILCVPLMLHGAAGDDAKRAFEPSEHIRVISEKQTMPHQLAVKWYGTHEILACLVADPQLTRYFPADMAQQILKTDPSGYSLHEKMDKFAQRKLSVDALKAGITQNAITALITATESKISCNFLRSDKKDDVVIESHTRDKCLLLIGKSSKDGVKWRHDFYRRPNIKILLDRGETKVVQDLKATYLAENEHDVAIEIDCEIIRNKLWEVAERERRSSPPVHYGGRMSWEPAQNLSEACTLS